MGFRVYFQELGPPIKEKVQVGAKQDSIGRMI